MRDERYQPILPDISQFEVDFVIPRVGIDLPVGIDPFLLFKSRDPELDSLHQTLLGSFNAGLSAVREGNIEQAKYLLDYPEVSEIGFGTATKKGKRGSGVGTFLTSLIVETLKDSPLLLERGVKHIEEMQLVSVGIGPDRISDISANIIKSYLIEYTQKQCSEWSIPLVKGVPMTHVFDSENNIWFDGYFDLPVSPIDNSPILLVPRRIVRSLPWINYEDFFKQEFSAYLRAKMVRSVLNTKPSKKDSETTKTEIISVTRGEIERIDSYIAKKELSASEAQPSQSYLIDENIAAEGERLKGLLGTIPTGAKDATRYQHTVLAILNFLFIPELIDGETEVNTLYGTERRDIIFTNDSDINYWSYVRQEHSSIFIMFEIKNMSEIGVDALNQTATYLGDRLGRLGFIITRNTPPETRQRKAFSIYNDSHPRKIILFISDEDLGYMIDMKCKGNDPSAYIQKKYRQFRTSVQ